MDERWKTNIGSVYNVCYLPHDMVLKIPQESTDR